MNKLILTLLGLSALINACAPSSSENDLSINQSSIERWNCIDTSTDFLYQMTEIDRSDSRYELSDIYPSQPWEMVTEIPKPLFDATTSRLVNVELARKNTEKTELWIRKGQDLIRYKTDTKDFSSISPFPHDKNGKAYEDAYVAGLFETIGGSIVGINYPLENDAVWENELPLFSIYNEIDNSFQFYDTGLSYESKDIEFGWVGMVPREGVLVKEYKGVIWIFQQQDGLYSYNPQSSELHHYKTSFDGIVQRMAISPDGLILFSQEREGSWELEPGELVQYEPVSQTSRELSVPFFHWPDYGTLLYTYSGDLWIGIHGYLSEDDDWVLKSPNRFVYTNLGLDSERFNWSHPELIFQSSNGYLWYSNSRWDSLGVSGAAWYDPESETTCWFTTEPGNIVEDDQRILWMVIDNKIYKYELPNN